MNKRLFPLAFGCVLLFQPFAASALTVRSGFNPNVLVPDVVFSDTRTFGGPEGIQRFLESKKSVLANTSPAFLAKLNEPDSPLLKTTLNDPEPNLGRLRTAAELIWDASQASGLNPQVIIVTLQKEQGLISTNVDQERLQRALNHAMGFDCPDATGCGNLFPGFYYQLFGNVDLEGNRYLSAPKSLMKSFSTPGGRGPSVAGSASKVGDSVPIENTMGDFAGILKNQVVTLGNLATAALYRYTPHVFNGNYNFWNYFISWFKYPNGTLLSSAQDGTVYIIQNGLRQRVPVFVAAARGMNLASAIAASPTELSDYPVGSTYGPVDNTIVSMSDKTFVFLAGVMHPASKFVLAQRKLDPSKMTPLTLSEADLFPQGSQLTPDNGTVLKGETDSAVYLVEHDILKRYSAVTLKQYNVSKSIQQVPDEEIAMYPKDGFVIPLEGTLVQSAHTNDVYLVNDQRRLLLTAELFKNLGFSMKNVVTLSSDEEIASIPLGPPAAPREGTYFSVNGSPELYLFKNGAKHPILSFIAKQRGITPDYSFDASIISNWPDGIAIAPRDETLLKSDVSPAVYLVSKGQLHPLTMQLVTNLGLKLKNVVTLSSAEIGLLPTGGYATPRNNTYFSVAGTKEFYVVKDGTKRPIYPLVAAQRGMTPDVSFAKEMADGWTMGIPVAPREGTLLTTKTNSTVYVVSQTKLRSLTTAAFKRRGYSTKQIKTISQSELDSYPKGDPILK